MSRRHIAPAALSITLAVGLAGCDGNPFPVMDSDNPATDGGVVTEGGGSGSSVTVFAETTTGDGFIKNLTYDAASDTYGVDNLAFDADNAYHRGTTTIGLYPAGELSSYRVYEPDNFVLDGIAGVSIHQFQHRMVTGTSRSGRTSFTIVRTGSYEGYGFGGFILQRDGGTTPPANIPNDGQAAYRGDYAGLRDYDGKSAEQNEVLDLGDALHYVTGRMEIDIDFRDFNDGDAVKGRVTDRRIFDMNGVDITSTILDQIEAKYNSRPSVLPTLIFDVTPNSISPNGQIRGTLSSSVLDLRGLEPVLTKLEEGNYYGILSGSGPNGPDELVGIVVVTGEDPQLGNVTVRETGGFVLYRPE